MSKSKLLVLWLMTGLALVTLLIFPTECRNGAANGVFLCIQVLIPSLFPFMVLSAFLVNSRLATCLPKWICRLTEKVFGLSGNCTSAILLSLLGGYPVGASGIKMLWKEKLITDTEAKKMALFCVASGPGFLVTYIGAAMTRSVKTGYILLISQTLSVIVLGILSRFTESRESEGKAPSVRGKAVFRNTLVPSVSAGIRSCGQMCALVVLFGAICEIFLTLTAHRSELRWMVSLLEITNGIKILSEGYPTVLYSAVCGFGGLCVHFQVFSQLEGIDFSKSLFYIFRILQGLISAGITYILLKLFPVTEEVFSTVESAQGKLNNTLIGCVMLIICSCVFLISIKNKTFRKAK